MLCYQYVNCTLKDIATQNLEFITSASASIEWNCNSTHCIDFNISTKSGIVLCTEGNKVGSTCVTTKANFKPVCSFVLHALTTNDWLMLMYCH